MTTLQRKKNNEHTRMFPSRQKTQRFLNHPSRKIFVGINPVATRHQITFRALSPRYPTTKRQTISSNTGNRKKQEKTKITKCSRIVRKKNN